MAAPTIGRDVAARGMATRIGPNLADLGQDVAMRTDPSTVAPARRRTAEYQVVASGAGH